MSQPFKADQIEREKPDPVEGSSTRWLAVPPLLLAFFLGFGVTYLTLQTENIERGRGDMRSKEAFSSQSQPATADGDTRDLISMGKTPYQRNCQACHQPTGMGLASAFPPLAGSRWVTESPDRLIAILLHGLSGKIEVQGETYSGAMPTFKEKLTDLEIAAIASYVRNSWGNKANPVKAEDVTRVKEAYPRAKPWKGQKELDQQEWDP